MLPGTPNLTLGGAVAADIHGKNHPDAGSLGRHVEWMVVLSGDLQPHLISPEHHPERFWATVGGLGLLALGRSIALATHGEPAQPSPATVQWPPLAGTCDSLEPGV